MHNTGKGPVNQIFIKVFGFSAAEKRLLLDGFQQAKTALITYSVWSLEAGQVAEAVLIDGDSWEAAIELANPEHDLLKLIWVGESRHPNAWRNISRPLQWTQILGCLAKLEAPLAANVGVGAGTHADINFDFDYADTEAPAESGVYVDGYSDTQPALDLEWATDTTEPTPLKAEDWTNDTPQNESRVLVIETRGHNQLYWRAKLGATGFALVDEAASSEAARNLLRLGSYKLVVLDLDSTAADGWEIIREIAAGMKGPSGTAQHLLVTGENLSRIDKVRAWISGASTMRKPLHLGKLKQLLERVKSTV